MAALVHVPSTSLRRAMKRAAARSAATSQPAMIVYSRFEDPPVCSGLLLPESGIDASARLSQLSRGTRPPIENHGWKGKARLSWLSRLRTGLTCMEGAMRTWIWIGAVLGCRVELVEAQTTDCPPPAISLIYQDEPVGGSHMTPELFAGRVEAKTISVTSGRPGEVALWGGLVSDLEGPDYPGVQGLSFMASTKG